METFLEKDKPPLPWKVRWRGESRIKFYVLIDWRVVNVKRSAVKRATETVFCCSNGFSPSNRYQISMFDIEMSMDIDFLPSNVLVWVALTVRLHAGGPKFIDGKRFSCCRVHSPEASRRRHGSFPYAGFSFLPSFPLDWMTKEIALKCLLPFQSDESLDGLCAFGVFLPNTIIFLFIMFLVALKIKKRQITASCDTNESRKSICDKSKSLFEGVEQSDIINGTGTWCETGVRWERRTETL